MATQEDQQHQKKKNASVRDGPETRSKQPQTAITIGDRHLLAPLRKPPLVFSKAAFVVNLRADVSAPEAPKPAKNDYRSVRT
jgi:hypothetical protein